MRVTVDPQVRPVFLDNALQPAGKGGIQGIIFVPGGNRWRCWQMVGHDHCRAIEATLQLIHQPRDTHSVTINGVLWREESVAIPDRGEILNQCLRLLTRRPGVPFAVEFKVGP